MGSETEAQTPPAEPAPAAPAKSGGGKGIIIAVAVIAVVAIVVIAFMFMGVGGIEGKWTMDSAEIYDADGTLNQTATDFYNAMDDDDHWMEFKSDGTAETGNATDTNDDAATWETSDGELSVTTTSIEVNSEYNSTTGNTTWNNETVTDTITFDYSVSGNTLTLEYEIEGKTIKMTATRD
ncbi:MAG: hypothetical protein KAJ33_04070 [Thermoplasmata archaeon]|nr:hypothetical protein [Thermoplasmata archaeon]